MKACNSATFALSFGYRSLKKKKCYRRSEHWLQEDTRRYKQKLISVDPPTTHYAGSKLRHGGRNLTAREERKMHQYLHASVTCCKYFITWEKKIGGGRWRNCGCN